MAPVTTNGRAPNAEPTSQLNTTTRNPSRVSRLASRWRRNARKPLTPISRVITTAATNPLIVSASS